MPDFIEGAKKGGMYGALSGAAVYALIGLFSGGPLAMLFFAAGGALKWGISGAIIGGVAKAVIGSNEAPAAAPAPKTEKSEVQVTQPSAPAISPKMEMQLDIPDANNTMSFVERENARQKNMLPRSKSGRVPQ